MIDSKVALRAAFATAGAFIAIAVLLYLTDITGYLLIMASFGASCVLLFALPEAPLAQPKNVIGGHMITALVGLLVAHFLPISPLVIALAVGIGIGLMVLTGTTHPPAGGNPLIILLAMPNADWLFLLFPVLSGTILLVIIASLYHPFTTKAYKHPFLPAFLRDRK